jgi:cytochrome c-type biogenesis protein CcmH/NrfG
MRTVNHAKTLLVFVAVTGCASAAFVWMRPTRVVEAPPSWIVDAAVAMSRADLAAAGHAGAAQQPRSQADFAAEAATYREAIRGNPRDADAWADLADSLAAAAGNDLRAGREEIRQALAIEPRHLKALWLRASLELQERRYAAAAATWRELQSLVAADSGDARIIAANIAEADALEAAAKRGKGS